jgi:hypothetical protein
MNELIAEVILPDVRYQLLLDAQHGQPKHETEKPESVDLTPMISTPKFVSSVIDLILHVACAFGSCYTSIVFPSLLLPVLFELDAFTQKRAAH